MGQEATVRTGYGTTDWFKIGKEYEPGGEAEEPDAERGPEGKDTKPGLLGGGSLPLE